MESRHEAICINASHSFSGLGGQIKPRIWGITALVPIDRNAREPMACARQHQRIRAEMFKKDIIAGRRKVVELCIRLFDNPRRDFFTFGAVPPLPVWAA